MNRYEQRRQKHLQNPAVVAGYRGMAAELQLMRVLDEVRKQEKITKEALATRMGRKREAISRLLTADEINPTLDTFIEMLSALRLTADITLRRSQEGEGPIKVVTESLLLSSAIFPGCLGAFAPLTQSAFVSRSEPFG